MVSQLRLTSNILRRIFCLGDENGLQIGTGFAIEVKDRQFLVTADHVAEHCGYQPSILFKDNDQWVPRKVAWQLIFNDQDADIAVLETEMELCPTDLHITLGSGGMAFGTVGFALGFPGVIDAAHIASQPWGCVGQLCLPLPVHTLVPIYSAEGQGDLPPKEVYCSGYLVPGYSGGPIVAPTETHANGWRVVGVCTKLTHTPLPGNVTIPAGILIAANIRPIINRLEAL